MLQPIRSRSPGRVTLALVARAVLAALAGCADAPHEVGSAALPVGLEALTDLAGLAELRPPGQRVEQVSSYDRSGGNADLGVGPDTAALLAGFGEPPVERDNSYLYREGDRLVIFDALGPGVVYRIWMTGLDALLRGALGGDIAFELDDEPAPRLVLTRSELFAGTVAPFLAPLAGNQDVSSGGFYSAVPIPFARRLRLSTSVVPNWLHVTWARLPAGAALTSFDPGVDTRGAAAVLAAAGADPKGIAATIEVESELSVSPGESLVVWQHEGPGTVLALEVVAPAGAAIPLGLWLRATWDGAAEPQVDAPLDDLFGAALGPAARSLAFGRAGDRLYFYFSMPFRRTARIAIANRGAARFSGWRLRLAALDRMLGRRPGLFHATARSARLEPDGHDYVLLERGGTGHVVGVVLTAGCAQRGGCELAQVPGLDGSHLEGDERVSVDGSHWPQIHGTGLEDFFSGGFYFLKGPFVLPTHGNPAQAPDGSPRRPGLNLRSTYRLFLGDAIPFFDGIRLAIEHGPANDVPAEMSSLVFHYGLEAPTLVESDRVEIGSPDSEARHAFSAAGRVDRILTAAWRGDDSDRPFTASGIEATVTRFRVAVDPANVGVRLRRLADVAAGRQSAEVRVNGEPAGTWYTAASNPVLRWAELDFEIPAALTRRRDSLEVELDAGASPEPWTSYGYVASSYFEP